MRRSLSALAVAVSLALAPALALGQETPEPLRVLRASPLGAATELSEVVVTFDRPVAGNLDATIDPRRVLRIEPAVQGTLAWRDPVTVVFTPAARLRMLAWYTVTVTNGFRAMDGSRLEKPYAFTFRVRGPKLLSENLVTPGAQLNQLPPQPRFELVWSSAVDPARVAQAAYLEFNQLCQGPRGVHLRAVGTRRIRETDDWALRDAGGYARDRRLDSLRRVVTLVPATPLARGCDGALVAATDLEAGAEFKRFPIHTYGAFALDSARCPEQPYCPTGPVQLSFTTPVRGADVLRHVRIYPALPFAIDDTTRTSTVWSLAGKLAPRTAYAVVVDTAMRDVFGQRLAGNPAAGVRTTAYGPLINYPYGKLLVERSGFGTLAVQHINVDSLVVTTAPVPDSLEGPFLGTGEWGWGTLWQQVLPGATITSIPVKAGQDQSIVTGIRLPTARRPDGRAGLLAVRITGPRHLVSESSTPVIALVQVTDLAVHAKMGAAAGVVWVTRVSDGAPVAGAAVTVNDRAGKPLARARTDADGIATFAHFASTDTTSDDDGAGDECEWECDYGSAFQGYVTAELGQDRALVGVGGYDADLSPWRFGVNAAWGNARFPIAGAVFTERGIYRPGEQLYAKAIVRRGALGALAAPAAGDSLRWRFRDRDGGVLRDTVVALSPFGTAQQQITIPAGAPLGSYVVQAQARFEGRWVTVGGADYRVAEYRPPEFLVDVTGPTRALYAGDSLRAAVQARYLFGGAMGDAALSWQVQQTPIGGWEIDIPGLERYEWNIGESGWWWERDEASTEVALSGEDTLDAGGRRAIAVALPRPPRGRAARVTFSATVTDVNRQVVGASTSTVVHPAAFYVAARPVGDSYFWRAGQPQSIQLLAVRPDGERVAGVPVRGWLIRREWHQVHRERDGQAEVVGEWVSDTVGRCGATTGAEPARCELTPPAGGSYVIAFATRDGDGRDVSTSFYRWAAGSDWVPWEDESRFKMDVIADRARYSVGDTATVMLASPFTGVDAWVTVEREGIIEQRHVRLTSGTTMLRLPITEAYAPNAFVSVVVARGRSAKPGRLDDPGRPTMRVGYAELRVTPEVKRLAVAVTPVSAEYRPGDSARVRLRVTDARGAGRRAEVTLWAVDEGVLALTGYRTPDPLDLLYQPRGLGLRLGSNLVSVAPQIPEGEKGRREPGGGGGAGWGDVLRSQFRSTAFFLGSVVTDADGNATAAAKLPDNLTTFRVMAVALTDGDRFGSGQSSLLVTRPVVARPALPRFVRPGDQLTAGTVVNLRTARAREVKVESQSDGIELRGRRDQQLAIESGRGVEARFPFAVARSATAGDSVTFRFRASAGRDVDAVQKRVVVRADYRPRAYVASGVVRDTASVELLLPEGIDPARSRLELSVGGSPLAIARGAWEYLHVYPYYCTEQTTSTGMPLVALYRAKQLGGADLELPARARHDLELAVELLSKRQRSDGGIGYWSPTDWTTPWLSAYAGTFLLEARAVGIAVEDSVLVRLAGYLGRSLHETPETVAELTRWYQRPSAALTDRVAAADYLSRMGRADVAAENQLVAQAAQLRWEDRARLAQLLARRGETAAARQLLEPQWRALRVEGRRAVLPDSARLEFYFPSTTRAAARLLQATLMVDAANPVVGPLAETLAQQGRASAWWNTQDMAATVTALADMERLRRASGNGTIRVRAGGANGRVIFERDVRAAATADSGIALAGLLADGPAGSRTKALRVAVERAPSGAPAYFYLTVHEVPLAPPVRPDDHGIVLERWYERYEDGTPVTSVTEGELVRVRLRVTVPSDREFVVVDDALPAGLEAVDLSLRTSAPPTGARKGEDTDHEEGRAEFGVWEGPWWSPFDHRELRDDRVVYFATQLWKGTYTATYVARATTPGVFVRPPAHAEEMYNPGVFGRTDGGVFTVRPSGGSQE